MDDEVNVSERWTGYLDNSSHSEIKRMIKDNINRMCADYISIGYCLKKVSDRKLFLEDGYCGIGDYAEKEFGIKDSKASKLISIIEKLSIDGNAPVLRDEYREFSIAKLEEIIYLDEQQRKEISPEMSKNEIRKVKSKEKVSPAKLEIELEEVVSTSKQEAEPKSEINPDAKLILEKLISEYYCPFPVWLEFLEKDIQDIGKEEAIKSFLQRHAGHGQEMPADNKCPGYGFTFYTVGNGTTKIELIYAGQKVMLLPEEFMTLFLEYRTDNATTKPSGKCIHRPEYQCTLLEASKLAEGDGINCNAKCCWNCSKHGDCGYECNSSHHRPVETVEDDKQIHRPDLRGMMQDPYCKVCGSSLEYKQDCTCGNQIDWSGLELVFEFEEEQLKLKDEQEQNEIVEADIVQPLSDEPVLPKLKNNDQRKEFIDNYSFWSIWIDQALTGERYYRYDLSDKVAMVVKVSKKHVHENYKETKAIEYGAEQYYLLGIKYEYGLKGSAFMEDESRTFYECCTNKSALVDYLKEFQKGKVD